MVCPRTTIEAFWKNGSFAEHVLWEINDTFVDTKPRGIEVTSTVMVTDNLGFPVWTTKALAVASERGYSNLCATFYEHNQRWSYTTSSLMHHQKTLSTKSIGITCSRHICDRHQMVSWPRHWILSRSYANSYNTVVMLGPLSWSKSLQGAELSEC